MSRQARAWAGTVRAKLPGEVPLEALQNAVEGQHGCSATFDRVERVVERHEGQAVWAGPVHVFKIRGHPDASECYAWSDPVPGSDKRRIYAVLQAGPVTTPREAVRAAIVQAYREAKEG